MALSGEPNESFNKLKGFCDNSQIYLMQVRCSVGKPQREKKVSASSLLFRMSLKFVLLAQKN
jgi:hypothetical protein